MRRSSFGAKGLRGSGFTPPKPTFSYTSLGVFTLTNWSALYSYATSPTAGTVTRSGTNNTVFTMSSTDTVVTVTPSFGLVGPSILLERKKYVYDQPVYHAGYCDGSYTFDECGGNSGYCPCGTYHPELGSCSGWVCHGNNVPGYYSYDGFNSSYGSTPYNYINSGSEWYKVT